MKLDIEKLQKVHYSLSDFEDDDIEDFEGHDIYDYDEGPDADDTTWLFPTKGPGEFKAKEEAKKKKRKAKRKKEKKKAAAEAKKAKEKKDKIYLRY